MSKATGRRPSHRLKVPCIRMKSPSRACSSGGWDSKWVKRAVLPNGSPSVPRRVAAVEREPAKHQPILTRGAALAFVELRSRCSAALVREALLHIIGQIGQVQADLDFPSPASARAFPDVEPQDKGRGLL